MKYVDQRFTSHNGEREKIRIPQFESLEEVINELDEDQITRLVNNTVRLKFLAKLRSVYLPETHPQITAWVIESNGIGDLLFPSRTNRFTAGDLADAVKKIILTDEQKDLLRKAGVEI